jgi:hypothetical protein
MLTLSVRGDWHPAHAYATQGVVPALRAALESADASTTAGEVMEAIAAAAPLHSVLQMLQQRDVTSSCQQQIVRAYEQALHELRHLDPYEPVARAVATQQAQDSASAAQLQHVQLRCRQGRASSSSSRDQEQPAGRQVSSAALSARQPADGGVPHAKVQQAAMSSSASSASDRTEQDAVAHKCPEHLQARAHGPATSGAEMCSTAELATVYMFLCRSAIERLHHQAQCSALLSPEGLRLVGELLHMLRAGRSSLIDDEVSCLQRQLGKLGVLDGNGAPLEALSDAFDFACSCPDDVCEAQRIF